MPNAWDPLKSGDTVAVVNPCMKDRNGGQHAEQYQALLHGEWGYKVNGLDALTSEKTGDRLWSGTAQERASSIINAICEPDNKAIFLLVGGDGANEAMKLVADWHEAELAEGREGLPKRGIPVVGLSNNTTVLNPLAQMGIISPIQGKLDAAVQEPQGSNPIIKQNAQALGDLLSGKAKKLDFSVEALNSSAQGYRGEEEAIEIVGGCNFHVIESSRTAFQVDAKGKYLTVEGPEEQCSVKETLQGLEKQGMLDGVKGIFLGHISGHSHQAGETDEQKRAVDAKRAEISEAAETLGVPVFSGMPWGHIRPGAAPDVYVPLHTDAKFTVTGDGPVLSVDPVRTQESLDLSFDSYSKQTKVSDHGVPIDGDPVIVSMETLLTDPNHPSLQDKNVVLAFTPKFGEPVSHMMGVSQSLSALLHKDSLAGVQSLTLDLSGAYDSEPLYRKLSGEAITPPHLYSGKPISEAIPDRAVYDAEMKSYLEDFSSEHLGGIPVDVGKYPIAEHVAKETGKPLAQIEAAYPMEDGTGRCNASSLADDFDNGKGTTRSVEHAQMEQIVKEGVDTATLTTLAKMDDVTHDVSHTAHSPGAKGKANEGPQLP